ncbi:hypothetical protein BYT27DRAFT_7202790 [Phlegmacium glaucopus]|nr:hypothetical protein BYT27DRAFT_7202790 [Phlegmacium glaucopus]
MADSSNSNQPRPRPRPKPVVKKADNAIPTSTPGASSSSGGLASSPPKRRVTAVEDTDEMFMRNRNRTSKTWKKLAEMNKEVPKAARTDSDSDSEMSPRGKNKRKKHDSNTPLWQADRVLARMLSEVVSDGSDSDLELIDISMTPNRTQNGKRKRQQRSRSRSITPPPALPLHQIQNAKNIVRQALAPVRRAASPTNVDFDESADAITLQPELKAIAREIAANSKHTHHMSDKAVPAPGTDYVTMTVKWQSHPMDRHGKAEEWQYRIDRSDSFRELFEATADDANIMAEGLVMTYRDKRFFPSVTPHTLKIWTETAELVACTKATYDYIRAHPQNTSFESSNTGKGPIGIDFNDEAGASGSASFPPESQPSEAESESDEDKFKLILRSALTANKEISLVVRPATKCGAIVKAFLQKAGLAGQYPEVFADAPANKGGRKSKAAEASKDPRLCLDGDKLDNASEIGDADLEDGDMIEVVGL